MGPRLNLPLRLPSPNPDLPSHGTSTSSKISFNIPDTAALLADLVSKNAKNGKVDVVGMSLGGYIAIYTAQKYPGLVEGRGLFVSGCGTVWPRPGSWSSWGMGFVIFKSVGFYAVYSFLWLGV
jgi:pimeloyl-ACP methyl ester carboxylesterase